MIYLASASPRRKELLKQIQIAYQQVVVEVDETILPQETPQHYVCRVALDKARAGRTKVPSIFPVLGADTAVVCDEYIFSKPTSQEEAKQMLKQLSGRVHQVMTGVAFITSTQEQVKLHVSQVHFRSLSETEIDAYVATGEPLDKAGSYAIQGLASTFIEYLEGSYSGVMGLPLFETAQLLAEAGIQVI